MTETQGSPIVSPQNSVPAGVIEELVARGLTRGGLTLDDVLGGLMDGVGADLSKEEVDAICAQIEAAGVTVEYEVELATDAVLVEVEATVVAEERVAMVPEDGDVEDLAPGERNAARKARFAKISPTRVAEAGRASGSSDPVRMYLKEIGRVPLLSGNEEVDLARRIEAGKEAEEKLADLAAADELVDLDIVERKMLERRARDGQHAKQALTEANLRLVVSIAK